MGILLNYAFITPGLRIADLENDATKPYIQSRGSWIESIRALRSFRNLLPLGLRTLRLDRLSTAVPNDLDPSTRFRHFIHLVNQTLSSGCLASSNSNLAITEGKAAVKKGDEIWILFGCPVPIVLRRGGSSFAVVSPAYINDVMDGQAVDGVVTPDKHNMWPSILKNRQIGPGPEYPYVSGKDERLVQIIRLL